MAAKKRVVPRLVGQRVHVRWHSPYDDWHWYTVRALEGGFVCLEGRSAPDGSLFTGDIFWVPASRIDMIFLGDHDPDEPLSEASQ